MTGIPSTHCAPYLNLSVQKKMNKQNPPQQYLSFIFCPEIPEEQFQTESISDCTVYPR